jgi:RNA polymerase sigma-70 factor (sigma-E family)
VDPSDEQDFTVFVRTHGDGLLRFARLLVPDAAEAEDILQTALLRLTRHWSRRLDSPVGYVRAALVNLARDRGRRSHLLPVPTLIDQDRQAGGPGRDGYGPDHAEAVTARARLDQILGGLPTRQRITVVLRVIEGFSEAETAEVMGCSPGTVKSNLARGLRKVRIALADDSGATGVDGPPRPLGVVRLDPLAGRGGPPPVTRSSGPDPHVRPDGTPVVRFPGSCHPAEESTR